MIEYILNDGTSIKINEAQICTISNREDGFLYITMSNGQQICAKKK